MRSTLIHRVLIYRNSSSPGSDVEWRHSAFYDIKALPVISSSMLLRSVQDLIDKMNER